MVLFTKITEEKRLAKKVLFQQKHHQTTTDNWCKIFKEIYQKIKINIKRIREKQKEMTKTMWKKDIKSKTTNKMFEFFDYKRETMKKLRFIEPDESEIAHS